MKSIRLLFTKPVQQCGGMMPSLKEYDFAKCIEYLQSENLQGQKWNFIYLRFLNAFQKLFRNKSKKWTCVEAVLHVIHDGGQTQMPAKITPQSLLIYLNKANIDNQNATNQYIKSKHQK